MARDQVSGTRLRVCHRALCWVPFCLQYIPFQLEASLYLYYHLYHADDSQLYLSFKVIRPSLAEVLAWLSTKKCVEQMMEWLSANLLKFNWDKTEVLIITSKRFRNLCIIIIDEFELEFPRSHKMCILAPFRTLLKIELIDLDLQGHFRKIRVKCWLYDNHRLNI